MLVMEYSKIEFNQSYIFNQYFLTLKPTPKVKNFLTHTYLPYFSDILLFFYQRNLAKQRFSGDEIIYIFLQYVYVFEPSVINLGNHFFDPSHLRYFYNFCQQLGYTELNSRLEFILEQIKKRDNYIMDYIKN